MKGIRKLFSNDIPKIIKSHTSSVLSLNSEVCVHDASKDIKVLFAKSSFGKESTIAVEQPRTPQILRSGKGTRLLLNRNQSAELTNVEHTDVSQMVLSAAYQCGVALDSPREMEAFEILNFQRGFMESKMLIEKSGPYLTHLEMVAARATRSLPLLGSIEKTAIGSASETGFNKLVRFATATSGMIDRARPSLHYLGSCIRPYIRKSIEGLRKLVQVSTTGSAEEPTKVSAKESIKGSINPHQIIMESKPRFGDANLDLKAPNNTKPMDVIMPKGTGTNLDENRVLVSNVEKPCYRYPTDLDFPPVEATASLKEKMPPEKEKMPQGKEKVSLDKMLLGNQNSSAEKTSSKNPVELNFELGEFRSGNDLHRTMAETKIRFGHPGPLIVNSPPPPSFIPTPSSKKPKKKLSRADALTTSGLDDGKSYSEVLKESAKTKLLFQKVSHGEDPSNRRQDKENVKVLERISSSKGGRIIRDVTTKFSQCLDYLEPRAISSYDNLLKKGEEMLPKVQAACEKVAVVATKTWRGCEGLGAKVAKPSKAALKSTYKYCQNVGLTVKKSCEDVCQHVIPTAKKSCDGVALTAKKTYENCGNAAVTAKKTYGGFSLRETYQEIGPTLVRSCKTCEKMAVDGVMKTASLVEETKQFAKKVPSLVVENLNYRSASKAVDNFKSNCLDPVVKTTTPSFLNANKALKDSFDRSIENMKKMVVRVSEENTAFKVGVKSACTNILNNASFKEVHNILEKKLFDEEIDPKYYRTKCSVAAPEPEVVASKTSPGPFVVDHHSCRFLNKANKLPGASSQSRPSSCSAILKANTVDYNKTHSRSSRLLKDRTSQPSQPSSQRRMSNVDANAVLKASADIAHHLSRTKKPQPQQVFGQYYVQHLEKHNTAFFDMEVYLKEVRTSGSASATHDARKKSSSRKSQ